MVLTENWVFFKTGLLLRCHRDTVAIKFICIIPKSEKEPNNTLTFI